MSVSDSFVLDDWMLKFLMEHTSNLDSLVRPLHHAQQESGIGHVADPVGVQAGSEQSWSEDFYSDGIGDIANDFNPDIITEGTITGNLAKLLEGKTLSNEDVVEHALSWLLDEELSAREYVSLPYS